MARGWARHTKTYATFSDIFGRKFDKKALQERIAQVSSGALLNAAAQLMEHHIDDRETRRQFVASAKSLGVTGDALHFVEEHIKEHTLVSPQGLLSVCKWLLAFGEPSKLKADIEVERAIGLTVWFCLIVSDYLSEGLGDSSAALKYEVVRNLVFNASEDLRLTVARTNYIYSKLAHDKSLYHEKEYVDFILDFRERFGYSVEDYLSVLFAVVMVFGKLPSPIGPGWAGNLNTLFVQTASSGIARRVIEDHLLLRLEDARKWARDTLDSPWDFTLFQERPLLALDEDWFFPISCKFIRDQMFSGLFHKLRHIYPKDDESFIRFFGRPFEEYAKLLVRKGTKGSELPYQITYEFPFVTARGESRSPEVMIRLGSKLLVIEAKARRMRLAGTVHGSGESVEKDLERLVTDPVKQAHDVLLELGSWKGKEIDLSEITDIYVLVVTMGEFPTLGAFENKIEQELRGYFTLPVRGHYHLDIEEFEYFCYLLGRRKPIFRVLENKTRLAANIPFKNFLADYSLPKRSPDFLMDDANAFVSRVTNTLFPQNEDAGSV